MASKGKRNRRRRRGEESPAGPSQTSRRQRPSASRRRRSEGVPKALIWGGAGGLVLLLAVIFGLVFSGAGSVSSFGVSLYQGEEILGGSELNFNEILDQGKPVVLNFWGGDCPPCRAEMPAFQRVYEDHKDEVIFLGLDAGGFMQLGTRQQALDLLAELNITYPAGAPPNRTPLVNYSVFSLPSTIFINANGDVTQRRVGAMSEAQLRSFINKLLGSS